MSTKYGQQLKPQTNVKLLQNTNIDSVYSNMGVCMPILCLQVATGVRMAYNGATERFSVKCEYSIFLIIIYDVSI